MFQDTVKAVGSLDLILKGPDGQVKYQTHVPNMVVDTGKTYISNRMINDTDTPMTHIAIGTSDVATDGGDIILGSEVVRKAFAIAPIKSLFNAVQYMSVFLAGEGTGAIHEAAIFNADVAGTMLCRTVFPTINKEESDSLTIIWNVIIN